MGGGLLELVHSLSELSRSCYRDTTSIAEDKGGRAFTSEGEQCFSYVHLGEKGLGSDFEKETFPKEPTKEESDSRLHQAAAEKKREGPSEPNRLGKKGGTTVVSYSSENHLFVRGTEYGNRR